MWQTAIDQALELLLCTPLDGSLLLGRRRGPIVTPSLEAAACFLPGSVAKGALEGAVDSGKLWFYMDNASRLMETCWRVYQRTATGIS